MKPLKLISEANGEPWIARKRVVAGRDAPIMDISASVQVLAVSVTPVGQASLLPWYSAS